MLQKIFRPQTTYTDWRYGRLLLSNLDVGRGWRRVPVVLDDVNFLLPCTRLPLVSPQDILESAVVRFDRSRDGAASESIYQSIVVVKKGATALNVMRMAEASVTCDEWQAFPDRRYRVRRVDTPLAGYDLIAYQLEETETGSINVNYIVLRIGYLIIRMYQSARNTTPSIDQTATLTEKVIQKVFRDFPELKDSPPRRPVDWFRDTTVPDPLRFATPHSDEIPPQFVLTDRKSLAVGQLYEGREAGLQAAEYQTFMSLNDFFFIQNHVVLYVDASKASVLMADLMRQFTTGSEPPAITHTWEAPIPADEAIYASGIQKRNEIITYFAVFLFRRDGVVAGYCGVGLDSDPMPELREIVERTLKRGAEL